MVKKKIKITKFGKLLLVGLILLIVLTIVGIKLIKTYKYHQTYEYKFIEAGYTLDDYNLVKDKLNDDELMYIIALEYNKNIPKIISEKYFMYKNLGRYISYLEKNKDKSITDVIALVNVNRDKPYYESLVTTDESKNEAMLVNKYHALSKNYEASDIVKVSSTYAYAGMSLNKEAYDAFRKLSDDARKEGFTIIILSSYRTYEYQEKIWNDRKNLKGEKEADAYAARPGSSEHETGYAIDVADYNHPLNFSEQESFKWMKDNSYKYGYILRYPEGKEDITGYDYESWHYRYVGVDLATKVYNEGITYDEYYEFYLNN